MLRNFLIIGSKGLLLLSKDFKNPITTQPRLIGSLMISMLELSKNTVGYQFSYIELVNISVNLVASESAKLYCVLFHDTRVDGKELGKTSQSNYTMPQAS